MPRPLVSVIIPAFNADKYIFEALEGVRRQTYSNWEIVIVNDGPGSTPQIVSDFSRTISQTLCLIERPESLGQSSARNIAMKKAKGEIIALLDADDFWLPEHLAAVCAVFETGSAGLVYSDGYVFRDTPAGERELLPIDNIKVTNPASDLFRRNFINPSSAAFSRRLMEAVGEFDTTLQVCEDIDYWIRVAIQGFQIMPTNKKTYYYRKPPGSLSSASAKNAEGMARIYEKYRQCGILPEAEILAKARDCHYAAGKLHWRKNPRAASQSFYKAWLLDKYSLMPMMAAGFTRCMSWMPSRAMNIFIGH